MQKEKLQSLLIVGGMIIATAIIVSILIGSGTTVINNTTKELGTLGNEGEYTRKTTAQGQTISYGPAILHRIIFGDGADQVYIGDAISTASPSSSNVVLNIDADVAGSVEVETLFKTGIIANVTGSNGVTFIISPR